MEARTPSAVTHRVSIQLPGRSVDIAVREDDVILAAARAQGLDLPSLCEQGWCITCACWVLAGQVDQSASRRFYPQDRDGGFALICTGRPRSDLVLRPGATEALRAHRDRHHLPVPRGTRNALSQVCDPAHFSPNFHRRERRLLCDRRRPAGRHGPAGCQRSQSSVPVVNNPGSGPECSTTIRSALALRHGALTRRAAAASPESHRAQE